MTNQIGDKKVFVEHLVQCKDLDSLMEEPVTVLIIQDVENVEEVAEKSAVKNAIMNMSGNTIVGHYVCPTGRTVMSEFMILKQGWRMQEELTPADKDLKTDEMFKID